MNTTPNRWVLLLAAAALLAVGCEDQETGLVVRHMLLQDIDDSCAYPVDDEQGLARGIIDLALRRSYEVAPLIENRLGNNVAIVEAESTDGRLDPNDITLTSATVEYTALDQLTANLPSSLKQPLSGTVTNEGGFFASAVEVLTPAMTDAIRQSEEFLVLNSFNEFEPVINRVITVIVRIRVKGKTLDGREIETNEFLFPLDLCVGCLVNFPAELVATNCETLPPDTDDPDADITCTNAIGTEQVPVSCLTCLTVATRIYGSEALARQVCLPNP